MIYQTPKEIFESSFQANCGGAVKGDSRMSPDGAYDAVGNTVKVGDLIKKIKGSKSTLTYKVIHIECAKFQGQLNIQTENFEWVRFRHVVKV